MLFKNDDVKLNIFELLQNPLNQCYEICKDYGDQYDFDKEVLIFDNFFEELKDTIVYLDQIYSAEIPAHFGLIRDNFLNFNNYISDFIVSNNITYNNFSIFLQFFISALHDLFDNMIKRVEPYSIDPARDFPEFVLNFYRSLKHYRNLLANILKLNDLTNDQRFILLENNLNKLLNDSSINTSNFNESVSDFLSKQRGIFEEKTSSLIQEYRKSFDDLQTKYEVDIKEKVKGLSDLLTQTDNDFKATYKDYDVLKKMINIKGEQLITDHYSKKASQEKKVYWSATITTIVIIILSISLAMCGLNEYNEKTNIPTSTLIEKYKDQSADKIEKIYAIAQKNALIYLVLRLVISLLIFLSIIYTSRVAYRAYVHMRHSENMMLKLATLRPFINQLEEEDRNQIHKDLVPDYFGKDAGMVDSTNEKFKDLPANISAVAMKAIEQISGGSSNNEARGKKDNTAE